MHTNTTNYLPSRLNSCHQAEVETYDLQDWIDHLDVDLHTEYRALIGDPVDRSQGSFWHNTESRKYNENTSYLKITMKNDEVESGLAQLASLNISKLSVTSPLKKDFAMGELSGVPKSYGIQILETPDEDIRFANTLDFDGEKWTGLDTDWIGMLSVFKELKTHGFESGTIALFGKGDVSRAVIAAINVTNWEIIYHTGARQGWVDGQTSDKNKSTRPRSATIVINMSGREAFEGACECEVWIDLHYRNTHRHRSALYFTGDTFFEAQAEAQREFWSKER